ncbi:hypothetical protein KJ618_00710, partial [Patescibacteria group bacterium]|nr:hypothetical protein [Patescibacteria group bacterium]
REGDGGRNIVEAAFYLMSDGYDKNWVRMALQNVAVFYGISGEELSNYLMIEAEKAQESSG